MISDTAHTSRIFQWQRHLRTAPRDLKAYLALGQELLRAELWTETLETMLLGLRFIPHEPLLFYHAGLAYEGLSRYSDAKSQFERATSSPVFFEAHYKLGDMCAKLGLWFQAARSFERAFQINPQHFPALLHSFEALSHIGQSQKILDICLPFVRGEMSRTHWFQQLNPQQQDAVTQWAKSGAVSLCIISQFSLPGFTLQDYLPLLKQLSQVHAPTPPSHTPQVKSKLRVGFLSNEWNHQTPRLIYQSLFEYLSADQDLYLLALNDGTEGVISRQLKPLFSRWSTTSDLSNDALAEQIRNLNIDVLIDLAGLMNHRRFGCLAQKPAPVQIAAGSNPVFSTGLSTVDFLVTDPELTPPDRAQHYPERVCYISSFIHRAMPPEYPLVTPPSLSRGQVCFGSSNTPNKYNAQVFKVWAEILKRIPGSHLYLKSMAYLDPELKHYTQQLFLQLGVDSQRILIEGPLPEHEHIPYFYNQLDIALDPFPYHGALTTFEALWMGVPVVSLQGGSRVAQSVLTHTGCNRFLAQDLDDYIQMAVDLASNVAQRQALRETLREKLRDSAIVDQERFGAEWVQLIKQFQRA